MIYNSGQTVDQNVSEVVFEQIPVSPSESIYLCCQIGKSILTMVWPRWVLVQYKDLCLGLASQHWMTDTCCVLYEEGTLCSVGMTGWVKTVVSRSGFYYRGSSLQVKHYSSLTAIPSSHIRASEVISSHSCDLTQAHNVWVIEFYCNIKWQLMM